MPLWHVSQPWMSARVVPVEITRSPAPQVLVNLQLLWSGRFCHVFGEHSLQTLSEVNIAASATKYPGRQLRSWRHSRAVNAVGAFDSYSPMLQLLWEPHARSFTAVGLTTSYSAQCRYARGHKMSADARQLAGHCHLDTANTPQA